MKFLAIYDGANFGAGDFDTALLITLVTMSLTFIVLIIVMYVIKLLNVIETKPKLEREKNVGQITSEKEKNLPALEEMDDDMIAATLVATIDYSNEGNKDVRLVSIKKIEEDKD